jgi:hypothetical protein
MNKPAALIRNEIKLKDHVIGQAGTNNTYDEELFKETFL